MKHVIMVMLGHLLVNSFGRLMPVTETPNNAFPCRLEKDPVYQGILVNCQKTGIYSLNLLENSIPPNTTSLFLDHNYISHISNDSIFTSGNLTNLRLLSLGANKIASIEPMTFVELKSLETLNLSHNCINLDHESLSGEVFRGLGNLSTLKLCHNNNYLLRKDRYYPDNLFEDLQNLVTLTLDTFRKDLDFGSLFESTPNLTNLTLTGGMKEITNDSFKSFGSIKLRKLKIYNAIQLCKTETGAFNHLKDLDSYILSYTRQDVAGTLQSLAPFVNRNMSKLIFENLFYNYKLVKKFAKNSIVTRNMARFLVQICVEKFALRRSNVFLIESGIFSRMGKCLKRLDLAYNPLNGVVLQLFSISFSHNLEYVKIFAGKYFPVVFKTSVWKPPVCAKKISPLVCTKRKSENDTGISSCNEIKKLMLAAVPRVDYFDSIPDKMAASLCPSGNKELPLLEKNTMSTLNPRIQTKRQVGKFPFNLISFPINLKIGIFNSISFHEMDLDGPLQIMGGGNVKELHIADNGYRYFTGPITGLTNITLFDISKNNGSVMSCTFFDSLSTIEHLNMASMNLDTNFMAGHSKCLLKSLTNLQTLDLSSNDLSFLSQDTFIFNPKLSVLNLTKNRYQSIPFELMYVPNLCWLDMRENNIQQLSSGDIDLLEEHFQKTKALSFSLNGNTFYCGCVNIRFLSWLQRTEINLDHNGNYTCILDSGQTTVTGHLDDLEAMWRKCNGNKAFLVSFMLTCFTLLAYLCCFIIQKFGTQLKALILKTFWFRLMLKTSSEYPVGVYIGYADQDVNLACVGLRKFIEEELRLSTYVRHRDLLPTEIIAESIVEALNSSWRVLLLVSQHFLDDHWSDYILKVSTYSVQADNPGRIVLVLISDDDPHNLLTNLPNCLLQAVREENIAVMTPQGNISYEDKQALKTALLYNS